MQVHGRCYLAVDLPGLPFACKCTTLEVLGYASAWLVAGGPPIFLGTCLPGDLRVQVHIVGCWAMQVHGRFLGYVVAW